MAVVFLHCAFIMAHSNGREPSALAFDRSYLDVLRKHHPRSVAVSAAIGQGLEDLCEAVMEALSADFAEAGNSISRALG